MICVRIEKKKQTIKQIIINGHSEYDKKGKDIVCSAVSSIVNGTVNFFLEKGSFFANVNISLNCVVLSFNNKNKISCVISEFVIYQLRNIEKNYPDNVSVSFF